MLNLRKTICLLFIFTCFSLLHAQHVGISHDSIVKVHNEDFGKPHYIHEVLDTASSTGDAEYHYHDGRLIYHLSVSFEGKQWTDSVIDVINYDAAGKKTSQTNRSVRYSTGIHERYHQNMNSGTWIDDSLHRILYSTPKDLQQSFRLYYDPMITLSSCIFNDSFSVAQIKFNWNTQKSLSIDTTFYFPGQLPKYIVYYRNGEFLDRVDFFYTFDKNKRVYEKKRVGHYNGKCTEITRYFYHDDDTLTAYFKRFDGDDSVNVHSMAIFYNDLGREVRLETWNNGKLERIDSTYYCTNGKRDYEIHRNGNGVFEGKYQMYYRFSRGKDEGWSFSPDGKCEYYRIDTVRTKSGYITKRYGCNIQLKPGEEKLPEHIDPTLWQEVEFDQYDRLVRNVQFEGGKMSSRSTVTFSK
jgi:hypothetical protein